MKEIADQLKKLIALNKKITNQLEGDKLDIALLEEKFDRRAEYVKKLGQLTDIVDPSSLSKKQKESFNVLFNRFDEQSQNIQEALNYIVEKSKGELDKAIKHSKAERSYQVLNHLRN